MLIGLFIAMIGTIFECMSYGDIDGRIDRTGAPRTALSTSVEYGRALDYWSQVSIHNAVVSVNKINKAWRHLFFISLLRNMA